MQRTYGWRWLKTGGVLLAAVLIECAGICAEEPPKSVAFANGFPDGFFPIGVWLQQPSRAGAYKKLGINTYVGLSSPPTIAQLAELERHGLYLVVEPSPAARALSQSQVIRAWMQTDEPDNAQPNSQGGFGDCIVPSEVVRRYQEIRAFDPTRPIFVNFGQAVANPTWFGRGPRCTEMAPKTYYISAAPGADIVGFDIYPISEGRQRHVMGKLELVGLGVANLKSWLGNTRPVWSAIETTHVKNPSRRPLPNEVRSEVWMALVHGANGILYFVHEWTPNFREDAVFRYPDIVEELTLINSEIASLAPVLNAPTVKDRVQVEGHAQIATMVKQHANNSYIVAVNTENKPVEVRIVLFRIPSMHLTDLSDNRQIRVDGDGIVEKFPAYGVRIYKTGD